MITNRVYVNNRGAGREDAFKEAERFAEYNHFEKKGRLHLRLLTEEMLGMVSEIGGDFDAEFWIENDDENYRLCLEAEISSMSAEKREKLLKTSTSGKNAAAKGIMGKLRNIVELYWTGYKEALSSPANPRFPEYTYMGMTSMSSTVFDSYWKLSDYKGEIESSENFSKTAEWDELEKSIVANIANDVSVGIKNDTVEMVITKKLNNI